MNEASDAARLRLRCVCMDADVDGSVYGFKVVTGEENLDDVGVGEVEERDEIDGEAILMRSVWIVWCLSTRLVC